jgi:hypothetical protein
MPCGAKSTCYAPQPMRSSSAGMTVGQCFRPVRARVLQPCLFTHNNSYCILKCRTSLAKYLELEACCLFLQAFHQEYKQGEQALSLCLSACATSGDPASMQATNTKMQCNTAEREQFASLCKRRKLEESTQPKKSATGVYLRS